MINSAASSTPIDAIIKDNKDTVATEQGNRAEQSWKEEATNKLLDLSTSNAEVLDFIYSTFDAGDVSPAKQQAVSFLLGVRTQTATLLSNIMRTILDGGDRIIRNIRA